MSERSFAKVVGIGTADGNQMLAVVDAADHVDLVRLAAFLGTDWVTLLTEHRMEEILPECEAGTIPPVPELVRVEVVADEAVRADPNISFHAGSHRTAVRVDREAWEREAGIRFGSFATAASAGRLTYRAAGSSSPRSARSSSACRQRIGPIALRELQLAEQRMRVDRDRLSQRLREVKPSSLVKQEGGVQVLGRDGPDDSLMLRARPQPRDKAAKEGQCVV